MDITAEIDELLLHSMDQLNQILQEEMKETERVHQELIEAKKKEIIHQIQATRTKCRELQRELSQKMSGYTVTVSDGIYT